MALRRSYGLILVVGLLFTIYTLSHSGKFHVVDEVSMFAVTESLGLRGAVDTNAIAWTQWVNSPGEVLGSFGPEGDVYSKKGVGPSLAALPWYMLLLLIARLNVGIGLLQSTLLWNGLVTALTAALVWLAAARLGYGDRTGAALAMLYGIGTIAWPYANQFFGEPLSAFGLMLGFYGLTSWALAPAGSPLGAGDAPWARSPLTRGWWALLGGVGAALAVMTVTANVLLVGLLAAYGVAALALTARRPAPDATSNAMSGRTQSETGGTVASPLGAVPAFPAYTRTAMKGIALFLAPVAIAGLLLLLYNFYRFGNPFDTGYHFGEGEGFTTPLLQGLYGLLLSPYRGVFWFTPLFVASLVLFVPFARRHVAEGVLIGAMSVVLVLFYSKWWMWWAGFAWGPRFLVPLAPFWVLLLAPAVEGLLGRFLAARRKVAGWRGFLAAPGAGGWLLIGLALVSVLVQAAAVAVNFVNYEIILRSEYPTDWSDPLAFGPPAQAITRILDSPVIGQFKLMDLGITANTDVAWLWQDGNIQMMVFVVGGAVLATLLALAADWWRTGTVDASRPASRPLQWLAVALPLLLVGVWSTEVSRHPHYGNAESGYRAVIADICRLAGSSDAVVTVAPYAYQIPMNWMGAECRPSPPVLGYATDSLQNPETQMVMSRTMEEVERIWFVTGGLPPNDPENLLERWLADAGYKASDEWYDDFRLLVYATPLSLANAPAGELGVPLSGADASQVTILSARIPETANPGDAVPVEIHYRIDGPNESNLRWFVQLLTEAGYPVVLLDTGPDAGYTPFSALPVGQNLIERAGLLLSPELPPGEYRVIAGLYNPDAPDAARLRTPDGADFVLLSALTVEE